MKCENLQFNLPLYVDEILAANERGLINAHLEKCPLCRARLTEFRVLRNDLRVLSRPDIPDGLLNSINNSIAVELKHSKREPSYIFPTGLREWLQYRLMPYSVGTALSLILTFFLLMTLLSTKEATQKSVEYAQANSNRTVILPVSNSNQKFDKLAATDTYSDVNLPIGNESPSINPTGALLALTKSIVRGKMEDEDVVVVADVFGDGMATIAEVVEAPRDERAMRNLEKALHEDPSYAPFVPAVQDNRSEVVRVIFKIQRVDIIEKTNRPKTKLRNR